MKMVQRVLRVADELRKFRSEESNFALIDNPTYAQYLFGIDSSNVMILFDVADQELSIAIYTDPRYSEKFQSIIKPMTDLRIEVNSDKPLNLANAKRPIYIDSAHMTVANFNSIFEGGESNLQTFDAGKVLQSIRSIKDDDEIEALERATAIADDALLALLKRGIVGKSEIEVKRAMDQLLLQFGADEPSFSTIIASGPNGSVPHATPSDRVIEGNDLVIIDYGATYKGYHSDTTRTVKANNRQFDANESSTIESVLAAHQYGVTKVISGSIGNEVDKSVREFFSEDERKNFIHGLGHGVGLEIHEYPFLIPGSNDVISDRNVVTVEPGLYYPGMHGVRIEDCYVVQSGEKTKLSSLPLVIS